MQNKMQKSLMKWENQTNIQTFFKTKDRLHLIINIQSNEKQQSTKVKWHLLSKMWSSGLNVSDNISRFLLNIGTVYICDQAHKVSEAHAHMGDVAQWLEHLSSNPKTLGSIPWRVRVRHSISVPLSQPLCRLVCVWPPPSCVWHAPKLALID